MENVMVLRKVTVKHIVTESLIANFTAEIKGTLDGVNQEIAEFEKEMRRAITEMTLKGNPRINEMRDHLEQEKQGMIIYKEQLEAKIDDVKSWQINQEVVQNTFEVPVEIKIGDNYDKLNDAVVIVQDGIVIEIRG